MQPHEKGNHSRQRVGITPDKIVIVLVVERF